MSSLRDNGIVLGIVAVIWLALWFRKRNSTHELRDRVAPYREPLVPEEFFKTCPPVTNERPCAVWIVRHYLPDYPSGAVRMTHAMNLYMRDVLGWEVYVVCPAPTSSAVNSIPLFGFHQKHEIEYALRKAHWIFTQYQVVETAAVTAQRARKPLVLVAHDDSLDPWIKLAKEVCGAQNVSLVANSNWLDDHYRYLGVRPCVLYPPVWPQDYRTHTTREFITLVNLNENKGARQFYAIARRMPEAKFLAVRGAYGAQVEPPRDLANVTVWPAQDDMRRVYAVTGVLCILSKAESWGRVGIEAACSGIPVVAHPTVGVQEALGDAGLYFDRDETDRWVEVLRQLRESALAYETRSRRVQRRAGELHPGAQLEAFRVWVESTPVFVAQDTNS